MSTTSIEWAALALLFLVMLAVSAAEIGWLVWRKWTTAGKAVGFVLSADVLGFGVGGGISLFCFFVMFMMVMGPAGRGSDISPGFYYLVLAVAIILPMIAFFMFRFFGLLIFGVRHGRPAWTYAALTTLLNTASLVAASGVIWYSTCFFTKCRD